MVNANNNSSPSVASRFAGVRSSRLLLVAAVGVCLSPAVQAIPLGGLGDSSGQDSFTTGTNWVPAGAPAAATAYTVASGQVLRTIADGGSRTFGGAGTTLTIASTASSGLYLMGTASSTTTINDLTLNSGTIRHQGSAATTATVDGVIHLTGTSIFNAIAAGKTLAIQSDIDGTGGVIHGANGTIVLSGDNSYSGDTVVRGLTIQGSAKATQGTLAPQGASRFVLNDTGSLTAATFRLNNFDGAVKGLSNGGAAIVEAESGSGNTSTLTINAQTDQTFSGTLRDGDGLGANDGTLALTKTGGAVQTISGAQAYTGLTKISAGTLRIDNSLGLGATSGDTMIDGSGTLGLTNGAIIGAAEDMTLEGRTTATAHIHNLSGDNTVADSLTLTNTGGNATRNYNFKSDAGTLNLTGGISSSPSGGIPPDTTNLNLSGLVGGTGKLSGPVALNTDANNVLEKSEAGTWDLDSNLGGLDSAKVSGGLLNVKAAQTYTGQTDVSGGTLRQGVADAIANSGNVVVDGTVQLGGNAAVPNLRP